jgi:hypothetical protein
MITLDRIGKVLETKFGEVFKIIEYISSRNCTIQFEDGFIMTNIRYSHALDGNIKKLNRVSAIFGVGYIGEGVFKSENSGKVTKEYSMWRGMLERCYNQKYQDKHSTYKGCYIDERWHNFQVFGHWFNKNYKSYMDEAWQIDKDILVEGNKIYSFETCALVPNEINALFTKRNASRGEYYIGVSKASKNRFRAQINNRDMKKYLGCYQTPEEAFHIYKTAKEEYIKEVANKWKGRIDPRVYEAMYRYEVKITD